MAERLSWVYRWIYRSARSSLIGARTIIIAAGCLAASRAPANFVDISTTSGKYDYHFTDPFTGAVVGAVGTGNAAQLDLTSPFATSPGALKIDYSSMVGAAGSFEFLQNLQCVGVCVGRIDTLVQTSITNLGSDPLSVRYDTQITPGHLGYFGTAQDTSSAFSVRIFEGTDPNVPVNLYDMAGEINGFGVNDISGSGAPFTGLTFSQSGLQRAFDWDATDVSLLLDPIAAGETRIISFMTSTFVQSVGGCDNPASCFNGAQVAFGDPRNNGGGTNGIFAINQEVLPFASFIRVTALGATAPVPEPLGWAMMLAGFAALGAAMRRRPARLLTA